MSGCDWCGTSGAVAVFEVLHEVKNAMTDRWMDVCRFCVRAAAWDGHKDPEVVSVQVCRITTVPAAAVAA